MTREEITAYAFTAANTDHKTVAYPAVKSMPWELSFRAEYPGGRVVTVTVHEDGRMSLYYWDNERHGTLNCVPADF